MQAISIFMKKGILWIFGDSYGTFQKSGDELKDWHWMWDLTDRLGHENFYNICQNGVANEWIYYQMIQHADQIDKESDTVIFITTQLNRQWFFPRNEGVGNINMPEFSNYVTREQAKAVELYSRHLTDNPQNNIRFQWLLYALHFLKIYKNLNLFVIPGFENEGFDFNTEDKIKGSLFDVCMNEIKGKSFNAWGKWIESVNGIDPREGHLSKENHPILAEKLFQYFKNKKDLDFTTGFMEEIIK